MAISAHVSEIGGRENDAASGLKYRSNVACCVFVVGGVSVSGLKARNTGTAGSFVASLLEDDR